MNMVLLKLLEEQKSLEQLLKLLILLDILEKPIMESFLMLRSEANAVNLAYTNLRFASTYRQSL